MADSSRCHPFLPSPPTSNIKLQHEEGEKDEEEAGAAAGEAHEEEAKSLRNARQMGSQTKAAKPEPSRGQSGWEIILPERCYLLGKFFAFAECIEKELCTSLTLPRE